jgi:hypothetical protein
MFKAVATTLTLAMLVAFALRDGKLGDSATQVMIAIFAVAAGWMWRRWFLDRQRPPGA